MDRRDFLKSATLAAGAAGLSGGAAAAPNSTTPQVAQAAAAHAAAPETKRWIEQRWLIDNIIKANGIDWDQPRSVYWNVPCGMEASADFAGIRARVQKWADCAPAFEAVARRREAKAKAAEEAGEKVTARENYFMAAIHWGAAQWPIDENNEQNLTYNKKKRECYSKYAQLADHKIEEVWIPFHGKQLPAWLHLPYGYTGGKVPAVVAVPGMDSFKEASVTLYGDRWLNRGVAVLAIEGPGQYESAVLGIYVSMPGWVEVGKIYYEWLARRPEIDADRIGVIGTSFGSFAGTIAAANEPRYKAVAVVAVAHEPHWTTVFNEACPTFKQRFMYMAGITDEAKFEDFRKTWTWEGHANKIKMPYLALAGESDELSPLHNTENLFKQLQGPKQLVVYQDSRHSVGGVPSVNLGPFPTTLVADWMMARFQDRPMPSERWYVDATGRVTKSAFA